MEPELTVVGGGLAGCEAAWQAASLGVRVRLIEMRPQRMTAAHRTADLAELVCSNSFKSERSDQSAGLLKREMRLLGSLVLPAADEARVPGGSALTVDRTLFARAVTQRIEATPRITLERTEALSLPDGPCVLATGPLTSDGLAASLRSLVGDEFLSFYDAISPIVEGDSLDRSKLFAATRWGEGEASYLNCPLGEAAYRDFWQALRSAERVEGHDEDVPFFESCLPIEVMADRGLLTLAYGPMKPVGLIDPTTGRRPYAVVQLRPENREGTLYNLVGFQTRMKWGEQKRVLRTLPGLEQAEFVRLGSIHRNTFLCAPKLLQPTLETRVRPRLFLAGQITGVEGYVESAATGILAGWNAARQIRGEPTFVPPPETMLGSLVRYVTTADPAHFQPMNSSFGLLPALDPPVKRRAERNEALSARALDRLASALARDRPAAGVHSSP